MDGSLLFVVSGMNVTIHCGLEIRLPKDALDSLHISASILTVMLAFAEYERGMIVERTQSAKLALRGNPDFHDGRPRKFTEQQITLALDLLDSGKSYGQVQKMTGISKSTMVRAKHNAKITEFLG